MYYIVDNPASDAGSQIWRVDNELNNEMVTNIGAPNSQISSLFVFNDELYFSANDGQRGAELWRVEETTELMGDFDDDGMVDVTDIDLLLESIGSDGANEFDLDGSGTVDTDDLRILIEDILQTRLGDLDLNGSVEFADFLSLSSSFGSEDAGWSDGDLDGNGRVEFADFLLLSSNFGVQ